MESLIFLQVQKQVTDVWGWEGRGDIPIYKVIQKWDSILESVRRVQEANRRRMDKSKKKTVENTIQDKWQENVKGWNRINQTICGWHNKLLNCGHKVKVIPSLRFKAYCVENKQWQDVQEVMEWKWKLP